MTAAVSALAPVLTTPALPPQSWMVRLIVKRLRASLKFTDERAKVESELLSGIEVAKCSTWEASFWNRIAVTRKKVSVVPHKVPRLLTSGL